MSINERCTMFDYEPLFIIVPFAAFGVTGYALCGSNGTTHFTEEEEAIAFCEEAWK